jgi:GDP-4-dehydro-6-deoxy-D-mannose reductase
VPEVQPKALKVLITGAGGMMGSHLAESLMGDAVEVHATYREPTIDMATVDERTQFTELDVCDREAVSTFLSQHRPEEIYHLAAQSLPTLSWSDPWRTMRVNVEGTINIFEAVLEVRKTDPGYDPMTVIACSSAEYGAAMTPERVPITEDAPLLPLHPYGRQQGCAGSSRLSVPSKLRPALHSSADFQLHWTAQAQRRGFGFRKGHRPSHA